MRTIQEMDIDVAKLIGIYQRKANSSHVVATEIHCHAFKPTVIRLEEHTEHETIRADGVRESYSRADINYYSVDDSKGGFLKAFVKVLGLKNPHFESLVYTWKAHQGMITIRQCLEPSPTVAVDKVFELTMLDAHETYRYPFKFED